MILLLWMTKRNRRNFNDQIIQFQIKRNNGQKRYLEERKKINKCQNKTNEVDFRGKKIKNRFTHKSAHFANVPYEKRCDCYFENFEPKTQSQFYRNLVTMFNCEINRVCVCVR